MSKDGVRKIWYCTSADGWEIHELDYEKRDELIDILRTTGTPVWERLCHVHLNPLERDRYFLLMGEQAYREFYYPNRATIKS